MKSPISWLKLPGGLLPRVPASCHAVSTSSSTEAQVTTGSKKPETGRNVGA